MGGAGILATGALFGLLRRVPEGPRLTRPEATKKLREDAGLYVFPATVPLAAVGAASASTTTRPGGEGLARPFGATFLLAASGGWVLTVVVGLLISWVHERYAMERMRAKLQDSVAERENLRGQISSLNARNDGRSADNRP